MRNLNVYGGSTSDFLDEVISSKRHSSKDPNYKQRVTLIAAHIKVLFANYDTAHNANSHINLVSYGYDAQDKTDLLKLYSYKNSKLIKLKKTITTVSDNRAMNTCQYCTIGPIGSFDHILPKGEFPEFSVNPKNLIPTCVNCNSHKNENWKEDDKTIFLNLYTDILPVVQYLFVELHITQNNIQPTFELRNTNNIDSDFFHLLNSHYRRLNLLQRFKEDSNKVISELTNLLNVSKDIISFDEILKIVKGKILEDKFIWGTNYYKSILEEAMINDLNYLNKIFL